MQAGRRGTIIQLHLIDLDHSSEPLPSGTAANQKNCSQRDALMQIAVLHSQSNNETTQKHN